MAAFEFGTLGSGTRWVAVGFLFGTGALMVSRLPTFSMKQMRIPRALTVPALVLAAVFVGAIATAPWATLLAAGALYLACLPLSVVLQRRATRPGPGESPT
jgi:CDP-diacylglycerol--serine O-phosphatidyltransferase